MNQPPQYPYDPQYPYGMQYPQYPQPAMPKRKKPLWPWIVALILVALVASCCFLVAIANPNARSAMPTGTWTTTRTIPGAATRTTDSFVVTGPWKLKWTCAPHTNYFGSYNLIIHVVYSGGKTDYAVNTICNYNNTSGEVQEADGGTVSLDIVANGEWVMTVQELE